MDSKRILLLILSLQLVDLCLSDFIETPSSMTVKFNVDQTVVFRCLHENPDATIRWELNGTASRQYLDIVDSFIIEMSTRVDTLTIPIIPAYNNTEVVCSAIDDGPTEDAPAATLTITDSVSIPEYPVETTTTVSTPSAADFDKAPSPLIVAVEEGMATFYCQHLTCDSIDWRVNGTSYNSIRSPHITRDDELDENEDRLYSLSFNTSLELNTSRVECVAIFSDGSPQQSTAPVILQVQGVPGKVKNASCKRRHSSDNHLITEWDPLPSLNLTNTEPDIVYRIQLNKITCGQNVSMGEETVSGTSRSITVEPHEIYEAIITPRNNVPLARDGEGVVVKEKFLSLDSHLPLLVRRLSTKFEDNLPVPSFYTMKLKPLDGFDGDSVVMINTSREGEMVELRLQRQLPSKRLWSVSALAHGCEVDTVVEGFELGTHDIQHINVSSPYPGSIRVTGDLVDNTDATGVLIVVSSSSDVQYIINSPTDLNTNVTLNVSTGGEYSVSVFALENGRPFTRVAALPRRVIVNGATDQGVIQRDQSIDYKLQSTSSGVCITCTFLESSTATVCVAVVHQRISQLNSSAGLMNIESSHKFTRSGDTASGCIEGVNLKDYQVGVVGGKQISPIISSQGSTQVILAAIICTVIAIVVVVVLALFIVIVRRRKMQPKKGEIHIANIPSVYSEVKLSSNSSCSCLCLSAASVVIGTAFDCVAQWRTASKQTAPDVEAANELPPPVPPKTEESNILIDDESPIQPAVVDSDGNVSVDRNNISGLSIDPTYDTPALPEASPRDMSQMQSLPVLPHYETPDLLRGAPDIQSNHPPLSTTQEAATSLSYTNDNKEVSQEHTRDHTSSTTNSDPVYSTPSSHKINSVSVSGDAIVGKSHTNGCVLTSTESGCPTYVETQLQPGSPSLVPRCPVAENVLYDEVNGFKNALGQQYAMLGQLPPSRFVVDDLDKTHTPYSEIKLSVDAEKALEVNTPGKVVDEPTSGKKSTVKPVTFTMEQLVDHLWPEASKWQELGTALSLDEDILDEIYTNNETDEDCLRDMLERYMKRSDMKHNWEEINKALAATEKDSSGDGGDQDKHAPAQETSTYISSTSTGSISDMQVAQCVDGGTCNTTISVHSTQTTPIVTGGECDDRAATAIYQPESHATEYLASFSPQAFSCCHEDSLPSVQQSHICQETQDDEMDYMSAMRKTLTLQVVPKSTVTPTTKKTIDSGDHATPSFHVDADADQDVPSTMRTVSVPRPHESTFISYDKSFEHMQKDGHVYIDKRLCDSLLGKSNLQNLMILAVLLAVMVVWDRRLSFVVCSNKFILMS